ncbi:hypothetical protein [Bacillus atrophaeus]|uniref:hypothetical protein n=1 Tax=Bacillus atrophaeus TaxID=1452 RepID=UPI002E1E981F|nr:hypothetical protein [Bacillus atrophaeus]
MFKDCPSISPVAQDFIWLAEYYRGHLSEFDFETKKENSFYDIDKEKLVRFGLIGKQKKMWFECSRGTFNLSGRRVDVRYRTEDQVYELTNQNLYQRDIITYKKAFSEANVGRKTEGEFKNNILSYSFGYKSEMEIEDVTFNFKPIVTLPHGREDNDHVLTVDLAADKDLDGYLEFIIGGKVVGSYEAPLQASVTGRLHWKVSIK